MVATMTEALPAWVADMLNRRFTVEQVLFDVAAGKRPPLTPDECRELALKLGIPSEAPKPSRFKLGQRVTKLRGSSWTGRVVGFYSTTLTPDGVCVESENEPGSVQIYPVAAVSEASDDEGAAHG